MALDCAHHSLFLLSQSCVELTQPYTPLAAVLGETGPQLQPLFFVARLQREVHHVVYSEIISKHRDEFGISACWEDSQGKF